MIRLRAIVGVLAGAWCASCLAAGAWSEITWRGERARAAESEGWRAIVSLDRGRLVHFGPVDTEENLLFVSESRGAEGGWGGHIVWLGPQAEWPAVWPPLGAWERSAAESHGVRDGWLELTMPESGDGWARLVRAYRWDGDALHCRVSTAGGTHDAQIMQIVQVPLPAVVRVASAAPGEATPAGFVLLDIGKPDQVVRKFPWPAQAARQDGGALLWRPTGVIVKAAFVPQPLVARLGSCELTLDRGGETGRVAGMVDAGLNSQLYLGGTGSTCLELEQMSPRFIAGGDDTGATIILRARKIP